MDHWSTAGTHDETFLGILREEKNVAGFFDALFGFLHRCTDFYVETPPEPSSSSGQRIGFPPGLAEQLVLGSLRKWQARARLSDLQPSSETNDTDQRSDKKLEKPTKEQGSASDCYNGAAYDKYGWSQTISELDVLVLIPEETRNAKDIRVHLDARRLEIALRSDDGGGSAGTTTWQTLLEGSFSQPIKSSESYWCLEPGKHLSLHLEKASERWWEALLDGEPRIELSKVDCSRNLEDMPEREQMKLEKLVWNQRRKSLGQPTSDQIKMERVLQKAWDADGSPFKGTEYDPTLVKFN